MPHISENEVEKIKNLHINAHKQVLEVANNEYWQGEYNAYGTVMAILDAIQPAPQSDEVKQAIEAAQCLVNWMNDRTLVSQAKGNEVLVYRLVANLPTLIRAAQSAPVDLERVRELLKYADFTESPYIRHEKVKESLSLLPTPSKE